MDCAPSIPAVEHPRWFVSAPPHGQRPAIVLEPTARHLELLRGLLESEGTGGNLANEAHLAALASEHGAEITTFDRDFSRFAGVRVFVPQ